MHSPEIRILGIRHHGPGSARAVAAGLADFKPDAVLIEGPPEADDLLEFAVDAEPPIALLAYQDGDPTSAAFWPFAQFSPEWQAMSHALEQGVTVRFCDLPAGNLLAMRTERIPGEGERLRADPLTMLAEAAGYDDAERWWEDVVEHRQGEDAFAVLTEAMSALRENAPEVDDDERLREARREAHMRKVIRSAVRDGHSRIAVVCGAWHAPALRSLPPATKDDQLLRGMPKTKVNLTWVPWSHGRLASCTGYGAGVASPGWYHHLFTVPDRPVERWLTAAARLLRGEGRPVSSAHIIEAVRLAEALAAVRGRPLAGLAEVTDAVRSVLCDGDELPVALIQERMVIGERLGSVPDDTPMMPLQRDLRAEQRRLRIKAEAGVRELDLDLRKPTDLDRSRLLHRLRIIGVEWGSPRGSRGKGTFHEIWQLQWRPELDLDLITASAWGTTVTAAATTRITERTASTARLDQLCELAELCLLADLASALPPLMTAIQAGAAGDNDVTHLMGALPNLARTMRYGDVRGTDVGALGAVLDSLVIRICVGLPPALSSLDDDAAAAMVGLIQEVNSALAQVASQSLRERWLATLGAVVGRAGLHGLIEGRLTRMLLDAGILDSAQAGTAMARAVSVGVDPPHAASWIEGFMAGGGLLLVHDDQLFGLVDDWITELSQEAFSGVLPLLRRTFGGFAAPERRSIGERVRSRATPSVTTSESFDADRAAAAVATVATILGRA